MPRAIAAPRSPPRFPTSAWRRLRSPGFLRLLIGTSLALLISVTALPAEAGTEESPSTEAPQATTPPDEAEVDEPRVEDNQIEDRQVSGEPDPSEGTPTDEPAEEPDQQPDSEAEAESDERDLGLPGPPPGFTEEQFRSFVNVVQACGFDAGRVCEQVLAWTGSSTLAEASQWIVDIPVRMALILLVAFAIHLAVRRSIAKYTGRVRNRTANDSDADARAIRRDLLRVTTASGTIGRVASVMIFSIAALIALGELGITLGPLLAGAGIAGIALGFGAQNLVRDVLAGLFVVFEDQYGVGDIIDAGRATGVVEEVTLRITKLRDVNGTLWFVPNGTIQEVGNLTQLWARAVIDFDIDYRADHERAGQIIKDTADRLWREDRPGLRVLEEPELWGVERLGDSSVVIRLAVKCAPSQQWKLARTLRGEVKTALDEAGIEIPFPQHTIWVHADPGLSEAVVTGARHAD